MSFSASPGTVAAGNPLTLSATVVNQGPGAARDATVSFSYPATADLRSPPAGCSQTSPGRVT